MAPSPAPSEPSPEAQPPVHAAPRGAVRDTTPLLRVRGLGLEAGGRTLVRNLDLDLGPGERVVVVGGNGAGKSTLLHALAGLREPTRGRVERPADPPGMLFQDGGLWPHLTVAEHLEFVDVRGDARWRQRLLEVFRLTQLGDRKPDALSGGERLRLSLARALAPRPRWLLLDEPLVHLDPEVATSVRETLPVLLDELGAASIVVTHDPEDVLHFGDRLLALSGHGPVWQGSARFALDAPPTAGLAAFSGRGTLFRGRADGSGRCDFGLGLTLDGCPSGCEVAAFLDASAVLLADDGHGLAARYVAPDRRGGSWLRVDERLLRSASNVYDARPGDTVHVRIEGRLRRLEDPGTEPTP